MKSVNKKTVFVSLLITLSVVMLVGLIRSVIPHFPEHSFSMIVGSLSYLLMVAIVLTSEWKYSLFSTVAIFSGAGFISLHLLLEMSIISAIRFPAMTNPFGYAALAAFLVAAVMKGLSYIDQWQKIRQYIHGIMTIGIGFIYWHVASIGVIATSWTFMIPFTLLLIWTLVHFTTVIVLEKKKAALL